MTRLSFANRWNAVSFKIVFSNLIHGAHQSDPANTRRMGLCVSDEILKASSALVWICAHEVTETVRKQKRKNVLKMTKVNSIKLGQKYLKNDWDLWDY